MTAYYNEIDPYCAQWLRSLIAAGHIAPGEVDTRSIEDVKPDDLRGFTQCHFFAGIAGWSRALRLGGWPDARPVWTGSCPCQPFSEAGDGGGFADKRHLWPAWFHLIRECRPGIIFGEQVASRDGLAWLDLVQSDLEGTDHTVATLDLCAAGFGAPTLRQRLWFMAYAYGYRFDAWKPGDIGEEEEARRAHGNVVDRCGLVGDAMPQGLPLRQPSELQGQRGGREGRATQQPSGAPVSGFWSDADWIACEDGKWRPVEPGSFPLAARLPNHVGRLRAYGNSIVTEAAEGFIRACVDELTRKPGKSRANPSLPRTPVNPPT